MLSHLRAPLLLASLLSLAGCKDEPANPAQAVAQASAGSQAGVAPHPAVAGPNPHAAASGGLTGTVLERIDAASYTYLRLQVQGGESWAAVPSTPVAVGTRVTIQSPMPMRGFQSKTLNRTFDEIAFGSAALVDGAATTVSAGAATVSAAAAQGPAAAPLIQVAKATGKNARTVAEVYAQRTALKDQQVAVRGKVVKVSNGILNRNWLHLRDGSGSEASKDNDLVVTTTSAVQVNDEVTVQGVVHTDKDIGSGYSYKVLVEDATVSR